MIPSRDNFDQPNPLNGRNSVLFLRLSSGKGQTARKREREMAGRDRSPPLFPATVGLSTPGILA